MTKARVLVIDDEPSVVDALKTILNDNGYQAVTATTAHHGLELASRLKFDLALIDFRLPDISGLAILPALLERQPDIFAILITSYDTPELRADAITAGFAAVLSKPFSPSILLDLAQGALARSKHR